ncbi:MAG: DEAD/DEAH box helicase [Bacteroidetes bacterium]|nr:DEAD/DEAH box helicase [Bacteroidota bacterium]
MNYKEFYSDAKRRSLETILSMWAAGNAEYQGYFKHLLENEENLFAEPVFQATFEWESSDRIFQELNDIFSPEFIHGLDHIENQELRFPADRKPYLHQLHSWYSLLNENKSIVVTSGTGSGKTECFMMPVLQDLMINKRNNAVQAIFLYPLNALIASQKKRMNAWCTALGGMRFAVYNGKTPENVNRDAALRYFPEIKSRKAIREQPPQIMFTNPTMLEYMMVRDRDQTIIQQSQGALRWILLDEAHTYSGSAAAEIALLIRRVLDAFGVTADQVRFAATSATIGNPDDFETTTGLKQFMSRLTGQQEDNIEIISGRRVVPMINLQNLPQEISGIPVTQQQIEELRAYMNGITALKATDIANIANLDSSLNFIDELGNPSLIPGLMDNNDTTVLLPTRGHFFARSIGGVSVCINPDCDIHVGLKPDRVLGALSTYMSTECACGAPMFELVRCSRCGEFLAIGELNNSDDRYRACSTRANESAFDFENELPDEDTDRVDANNQINSWTQVVLAKHSDRLDQQDSSSITVRHDGDNYMIEIGGGEHFGCIPNAPICPCCKADSKYFRHFRFSSDFFNRMLSYTLLEQAPIVRNKTGLTWEGRKYIAFTDSRQGTAKSALAQNIDIERIWVQSRVFHYLSKKRTDNYRPLNLVEIQQLEIYRQHPGVFAEQIMILEGRQNATQNLDALPIQRVTWTELVDFFCNDYIITKEICLLADGILGINSTNGFTAEHRNYINWLLIDQFARRPKKANSPENLGLVKCVYPNLGNLAAPEEFLNLNTTLTDRSWHEYLKIIIDYYLRDNLYVEIPREIKKFRTSNYFYDKRIQPWNFETPENHRWRVYRWPQVNRIRPSRLVLLLCAAAGWDNWDIVTPTEEDTLNSILQIAWRQLIQSKILQGDANHGYAMKLSESMAFETISEALLCPLTNVPLDTSFMGINPRITGDLSQMTMGRFSLQNCTIIQYPCFPYSNRLDNLNDGNEISKNTILAWLEANLEHLKGMGLWSNMHERIYLKPDIYLAAEHSAQQASQVLEILERKFEEGRINILSCSTTMEMGVDIGGISEVVMNNVPPSPANYLQRAGRAGRRNEPKALAITFCGANPIGRNVMDNPLWAMNHRIVLPTVRFESPNIIQRHVNAYLISKFVINFPGIGGLPITGKVGDFFGVSDEIVPDFIDPSIFADFRSYLIEIRNNPDASVDAGITQIVQQTVLERRGYYALVSNCLEAINYTNESFIENLNELNQNVIDLLGVGFTENSPAIKSLTYRKRSLIRKHLLGYLAETLFLPNANMPTGVVEFDITNKNNIQERLGHIENNQEPDIPQEDNSAFSVISENPSFHISRALSDYAPGRQVIINQHCYTSGGIKLRSRWNEQSMLRISRCSQCHTTLSLFNQQSCHCGALLRPVHSGTNQNYTVAIEPAGFCVDFNQEPTRVIDNDEFSIVDTELINTTDWIGNGNTFNIETRVSFENSEIVYYNNGSGFGYAVCIHCGRAQKETDIGNPNDGMMNPHRRLRGGRNEDPQVIDYCTGNDINHYGIKRNVLLIGRLQTDFVEIRISDLDGFVNTIDVARSLGVVFAQELAHLLGINESEIAYGVKRYHGYISIYLFDTAKGGAGYSNQFILYTQQILDASRRRLEACNCQKACTRCLIDRSSQWHLEELDRFAGLNWLNLEFNSRTIIPETLINDSPEAKRVTRDITSELSNWIERRTAEEIMFFIDEDVSAWQIEQWKLLNVLKEQKFVYGKQVSFVLLGIPIVDRTTYMEINRLKSWAQVFYLNDQNILIRPLATIKLASDHGYEIRNFYSLERNNSFDKYWGNGQAVYTDNRNIKFDLIRFDPQLPQNSNTILFYLNERRSGSKHIAQLFANHIRQMDREFWQQIENDFRGKQVTVSYSDRYVLSKFNSILLLHFISAVTKILNMEIEQIELNLEPIRNQNKPILKIWDNWNSNRERSDFLREAIKNAIDIDENSILMNDNDHATHYRQLVVESADRVLIIQPDGGFGQGWKYDRYTGSGNYDEINSDNEMIVFNDTGQNGIQYVVVLEE